MDLSDIDQIDNLIGMLDAKRIADGVYEKRKSPRHGTDILVRFVKQDLKGGFQQDVLRNASISRIVDISQHGVALESKNTLYMGDTVLVESTNQACPFLAELRIVHFRKKGDTFRYGCRFVKVHQTGAKPADGAPAGDRAGV